MDIDTPNLGGAVSAQRVPPSSVFAEGAQGTLTEIIEPSNLQPLNVALHFFFEDLRHARFQYETGADDGRYGAFIALGAVWRFIVLFKEPRAESLQVPILYLQDALQALDKNNVFPILKPTPRKGRAVSGEARAVLKGHTAGTVGRLLQTGLRRQDAYREVAKLLSRCGVRPERRSTKVTADTVRRWCDEVASDFGRRGTAAKMHDKLFVQTEQERFSALLPEKARSISMESLAGFVHALFPGLGRQKT